MVGSMAGCEEGARAGGRVEVSMPSSSCCCCLAEVGGCDCCVDGEAAMV